MYARCVSSQLLYKMIALFLLYLQYPIAHAQASNGAVLAEKQTTQHTRYSYVHDLIIHEMLREKERQGNTTQQKDKATQHNSPKAVIFQRKNCLGWDTCI